MSLTEAETATMAPQRRMDREVFILSVVVCLYMDFGVEGEEMRTVSKKEEIRASFIVLKYFFSSRYPDLYLPF